MVASRRIAQASQVQAEFVLARSAATEHQAFARSESEGFKQQNRRAKVIIVNPAPVVASTCESHECRRRIGRRPWERIR